MEIPSRAPLTPQERGGGQVDQRLIDVRYLRALAAGTLREHDIATGIHQIAEEYTSLTGFGDQKGEVRVTREEAVQYFSRSVAK